MRRELDRMAGELLRRQSEVDVCLSILARRESLRAVYNASGGAIRAGRAYYRWVRA